jgi:hypothetical protein
VPASFKSSPRTTHRLHALGCFIVVLLFAVRVSSAKHPVLLDPKADPSTCIACHEDKSKGKSVHLVFLGVTYVLSDYGVYTRGPPGLDSNDSGNEVRPTESERIQP